MSNHSYRRSQNCKETEKMERGKKREIERRKYSVIDDVADTSVFIAAVSAKEEEIERWS